MNCHSISIASLSSIVGQWTNIKAYGEEKNGEPRSLSEIISYLVCLSPAGRWLHGSIRVQVGCHVNRVDPLASPPTWTRVSSRRSYRYKPASPAALEQLEKRISFTDNGQPWPSLFSLDQRAGPKARSRLWTILQEPSCRYTLNDYSNVDALFTICSLVERRVERKLRWSTRWMNAIRWILERRITKTSLLAEMQSDHPKFVVDWTMSDGGTVNWITTYHTPTCHRVENTLDSGSSWWPPLASPPESVNSLLILVTWWSSLWFRSLNTLKCWSCC